MQLAGDGLSDCRRRDGMAPWRCGRGGERAVLYHSSRMWFPRVEKCEFSGPALVVMTPSSETD